MTDVAASRPLRKDAARNRALLVQAAREVFAERGLEASLDDVARHAGLGVGTAYRHFANKHELAQAILTEAIDRIVALADAAVATEDPWLGIVTFLEGVAEAQTADRGLREVLMGMHDPAEVERISERMREPMQIIVGRARAAGAVRPDIEPSDLGFVVMMLCTVADVTGDVAPDLWRRYLPLLLDGLTGKSALPVTALDDDEMREAMMSHKQQLARASHQPKSACEPA
jgi:AcrR family transcriptional regulator